VLHGRNSNPRRGKFFLFSCPKDIGGDFPGVKWPGHEADHSSPSSAEVKNGGDILPPPHVSSGMVASLIRHKDIFIKLC
jgi:hypothetical protein